MTLLKEPAFRHKFGSLFLQGACLAIQSAPALGVFLTALAHLLLLDLDLALALLHLARGPVDRFLKAGQPIAALLVALIELAANVRQFLPCGCQFLALLLEVCLLHIKRRGRLCRYLGNGRRSGDLQVALATLEVRAALLPIMLTLYLGLGKSVAFFFKPNHLHSKLGYLFLKCIRTWVIMRRSFHRAAAGYFQADKEVHRPERDAVPVNQIRPRGSLTVDENDLGRRQLAKCQPTRAAPRDTRPAASPRRERGGRNPGRCQSKNRPGSTGKTCFVRRGGPPARRSATNRQARRTPRDGRIRW